MKKSNVYKLLGLTPPVTRAQVITAYRKLAMKFHPDKGGSATRFREITEAKLYATRVHFQVADVCLQLHGGYGYMLEFPIQRAWRDSRLARIGAGADEVMLDYVAKHMGL